MSKREDYQKHIEEALDLWDARFEALKTKAGKEPPPETQKQLELWKAASAATRAKLVELQATTGDRWDVVKEEVEKSWRAMEPVLDAGDPAVAQFTKEELQALTPEQQDAILEALVVAVVADGKVGQDEVAVFNRAIARISWAQPKEAVIEKAQAAQARIAALKTEPERLAALKSIAARLPKGSIAEKTLAAMAMVMAADKAVDLAEKQTLSTFALAFGIATDRLKVIAASLRAA